MLAFEEHIIEESYRFPANVDIVTVEHLERAKLFAKRDIPEKKITKRSTLKVRRDLQSSDVEDIVEDDQEKPKRKRATKEDDLNIKSAQVKCFVFIV